MAINYSSQRTFEISSKLEVALFVIDSKTDKILFAGNKVTRDLGLTFEEIHEKEFWKLFTDDFTRFYKDLLAKTGLEGSNTGVYFWTERNIWEQVSVTHICWNESPAILLSITNVDDIAQKEYEYKQLAFYNPVTRLPNERKLELDIASIAKHEQIELTFFRIENLLDICDLYGWGAGDSLLVLIRDWLQDTKLPRTEIYQSSSVFILLSHEDSEKSLIDQAMSVKDRFSKPWIISSGQEKFSLHCIANIGMVRGQYIQNEMRNIIMRTLNRGERGDKRLLIYDEASDQYIKRLRFLRSKLTDSIFTGMKGFSVKYHPIIDTKKGSWTGVEALCRWQLENGDYVPPSEFIPIVEQLNLVAQLDNWVHTKAMTECYTIGLDRKEFFLDVNFSPSQGLDESAVQTILETSFSTGFPLENLVLEITESERMRFDEKSFFAFELLKKAGVSVGLDDFGSGFSSIENLFKVSAVVLKTDKMMVDDIENDPSRELLMKTLINLAHDLKMRIVVEGVEREIQYKILEELGADYIQGYYFSEPLTMEELEKETWRYSDTFFE